jgi:hypothetical protein
VVYRLGWEDAGSKIGAREKRGIYWQRNGSMKRDLRGQMVDIILSGRMGYLNWSKSLIGPRLSRRMMVGTTQDRKVVVAVVVVVVVVGKRKAARDRWTERRCRV